MIIVLTYDHPHRKTQDLLFRLKAYGESVQVMSVPFKERKQRRPLVKHRPDRCIDISLEKLCKNLELHLDKRNDYNDIFNIINLQKDLQESEHINKILIAGAGILPKELTDKFNIINSHPGYIPMCRGFDSLKWDILLGYPIGVTTHIIDSEADLGEIIEQRFIPINYEDSFYELAMRVYETEIEMLLNAKTDGIIKKSSKRNFNLDEIRPVRKRMNNFDEMRMLDKFEQLRKNSLSKWD